VGEARQFGVTSMAKQQRPLHATTNQHIKNILFTACDSASSMFEKEFSTTWSNAAWAMVLGVVDEVTGVALL
jgi:hypothetical protein